MKTELYYLILTLLLSACFWLPYIINRIIEQGIFEALYDPDGVTISKQPWANRLMSAHKNNTENLAIFAPSIILLSLFNLSTESTQLAAMIYFYSRIAHAVVFTFRVPYLRITIFLVGWGAQISILLTLLNGH